MTDDQNKKFYQPSPQDVDAFMFAAINGNNAALTELLDKYGPNIINRKDNSGGSALMNNPGEQSGGMTALMYAAWGGHKSAVALLLERGALPAVDAKEEADAVRILTQGSIK